MIKNFLFKIALFFHIIKPQKFEKINIQIEDYKLVKNSNIFKFDLKNKNLVLYKDKRTIKPKDISKKKLKQKVKAIFSSTFKPC